MAIQSALDGDSGPKDLLPNPFLVLESPKKGDRQMQIYRGISFQPVIQRIDDRLEAYPRGTTNSCRSQ